MQMSERQWRVLSLLERLERGEVTVGEVAASLRRSRRQVQRMRKRVAGKGAAGLVHGNAGRCSKHRTSGEVRERVVMLRRGKYDGFNDQHFTEKLAEVEGLRLSRETVRCILREAGIGSPRKRRPPKHRQRRERKAQAYACCGTFSGKRAFHIPSMATATAACAATTSTGRSRRSWRVGQEPTQVGRVLANLGVEMRYALSAPAKGRVERLWGVLQDRLISKLRLAGASTRGQANKVLSEYRHAHNARFAVAPQDTQPAWRKAPSDHTTLLDLCALHYVRKVHKNHTVRIHGRVIDIPRRPDSAYATYAAKDVVVKHLLSGDYRVFYDEQCIAWATGSRPKPSTGSNRNNDNEETAVAVTFPRCS